MAGKLTDRIASTRVGGVFFRPDQVKPGLTAQEDRPVAQVAQTRPATPAVFGSSTVPLVIPSSVDPEVRAKIQAIADGADQKSFSKFGDLVRSMRTRIPDEASLYRAALAAAEAFSLSLAEVLRGADVILAELSGAESRFREAAPQRIAAKVGARREKIAGIQRTLSEKRADVERLKQQIGILGSDIQTLSQAERDEEQAISQDERAIQDDVTKFLAALEVVRAPYLAERQKIEQYGRVA